MPEIKRQTAYKCTINQILSGNYIQKTGWDPNYIELGNQQISRVNIIAIVVSREDNSILIDDGSGQISMMLFNDSTSASNISVGDIILVIGRPREYNSQRYIAPEIIRKIEDKRWIDYRKQELNMLTDSQKIIKKETEQSATQSYEPTKEKKYEEEPIDNYAHNIITLIKKLDAGSGADINEVIKQSKIKDTEKYITALLNEGEIFELRAGKLKVLE